MRKIHKVLDELTELACPAINGQNNEPLFYDFLNRIEAIRDMTTPIWQKLWNKLVSSRPIKDTEIPF